MKNLTGKTVNCGNRVKLDLRGWTAGTHDFAFWIGNERTGRARAVYHRKSSQVTNRRCLRFLTASWHADLFATICNS